MQLSTHFTLDEMTHSDYALRHSLVNTPGPNAMENLRVLCADFLEPIRAEFCRPIVVSSGYRSTQVNLGIGSTVMSAHPDGRAVDFTIPGEPLTKVYEWIAGSNLPFDQLIYEYDRWIHLGIARPGKDPRRQLLRKLAGRPYEPYYIAAGP